MCYFIYVKISHYDYILKDVDKNIFFVTNGDEELVGGTIGRVKYYISEKYRPVPQSDDKTKIITWFLVLANIL